MTLQEIAVYLNCHYGAAYRLARQGIMPSFKLSGNWRVLKSEIDEWIAAGGGKAVLWLGKAGQKQRCGKREAPDGPTTGPSVEQGPAFSVCTG